MVSKVIKWIIFFALLYLAYHILGGSPTEQKFLKQLDTRASHREFKDGFENAKQLHELFTKDGKRWHSLNIHNPTDSRFASSIKYCQIDSLLCSSNRDGNSIEITTSTKKRGNQSLKIIAQPSDLESAKFSRASIRHHGLNFKNGNDVYIGFWMKLEGDKKTITSKDLIFVGLREQKRPFKNRREGGRFMYLADKEAIASDIFFHLPKPEAMTQPLLDKIPFTKNKWVKIDIEMKLSHLDSGSVRVWQDNKPVLTRNGRTLIDSETVFNILEVGVIGHDSQNHQQVMYLDDVEVRLGKR